ncbi:MAG TPA: ParA family protein [Rhizomicrobium sp.]|jgi:MinD-like ATPase involved in chromosome partitioning or flagellar assembly|nr:ParA family protein [Rhizomicrobium sp.]
MYVVTFYSYRGGVGRTLSLLNTAVELAKRGRKILVVDFDLEAPGISTFHFCKSGNLSKGIVDYIAEYKETGRAPNVTEFVQECELIDGGHQLKFWLMSAGRQDEHYARKFHSIDWERLYADHAGFLMIENLKEQWNDSLTPDYVFIDSRTGHTDISGICTRQLPDAVVFTFLPNLQNLSGLSHVVKETREEVQTDRKKVIRTYFVASNVPTADDESGILRENLEKFRAALNYDHDNLTLVFHYDSLALLGQEIFTLTKPNTKLAKEYVSLANSILRGNPADRDGALAYILDVIEKVRTDRRKYADDAGLTDMMENIAKHHPRDGEVHFKLADLYVALRSFPEATSQYELAKANGYETAELLLTLSFLYSEQKRREEATALLLKLTEAPSADLDVHIAILQLIRIDITKVPDALNSNGVRKLGALERLKLANILLRKRELLPNAMQFFVEAGASNSLEEGARDSARYKITLCKIASGDFADALRDLGDRQRVLNSDDVGDVFNFAMAEWGATQVPPLDMLNRVLELSPKRLAPDANFAQCLAVATHLVGDSSAASDWLTRARELASRQSQQSIEFSCWSYLNTTIAEFIEELGQVQRFINGDRVVPAFMDATIRRSERVPRLTAGQGY